MSEGTTGQIPHRYYEKEFPEPDELVVVNVKSISEMGAYVSLLEYNNIEGMILLSELSRRRIRSINKLIRVGRNEVVKVMRVDEEKGYIDLSKRRVDAEEVAKCEDRYNKAKMVHNMLRAVMQKTEVGVDELYEQVVWPLARKYGNAYKGFKMAVTEAEKVFQEAEVGLKGGALEELKSVIAKRMTPQPVKIRADVQVTCFEYEGIEGIRKALQAGEAHSTEELPIKIQLIAPPLYVLLCQSLDEEKGIAALTAAVDSIKTTIEAAGGELHVKAEPRVTSQTDDTELSKMLEELELENAEVDGDEEEGDGE
jgi:translation initiation factor 2 subunit 1